MSEVKRPRGRPRNEEVKDTIASLAAQVRALEAQRVVDTKKLDEVLFKLGEMSALVALGRDE